MTLQCRKQNDVFNIILRALPVNFRFRGNVSETILLYAVGNIPCDWGRNRNVGAPQSKRIHTLFCGGSVSVADVAFCPVMFPFSCTKRQNAISASAMSSSAPKRTFFGLHPFLFAPEKKWVEMPQLDSVPAPNESGVVPSGGVLSERSESTQSIAQGGSRQNGLATFRSV